MIYLELFLLSLIVSFLINLSGAIDSLKRFIFRLIRGSEAQYINYELKPIDCSLCMTFWTSIIYTVCSSSFTVFTFVFICVLSYYTLHITGIYTLIDDLLTSVKIKIYSKWID